MSDPTLFDYSMIKGTVEAILFQTVDDFLCPAKVDLWNQINLIQCQLL